MIKEKTGKVIAMYPVKELNTGSKAQKISFQPDGEEQIYLNLFNNLHIVKNIKVGDEVKVTIKEVVNGNYVNSYLNSIRLCSEVEEELIKEQKYEEKIMQSAKQLQLVKEFEDYERRIINKLYIDRPELRDLNSTQLINCIRLGLYLIHKMEEKNKKAGFVNLYNNLKNLTEVQIKDYDFKLKNMFGVKENKVVNLYYILN